nr:uncharacterized protein LOC112061636 [Chrysemys picta bellii]
MSKGEVFAPPPLTHWRGEVKRCRAEQLLPRAVRCSALVFALLPPAGIGALHCAPSSRGSGQRLWRHVRPVCKEAAAGVLPWAAPPLPPGWLEFRKRDMEADTLKDEDHMAEWTANDPARLVPSPSKITEKAMCFLPPGQINSTNGSFNEQFTPFCYSADSSMMGSNGSSSDNRFHGQAFQDAKQLNYLASSALFPHLLASSITQTGIVQGSKSSDLETLSPVAAAPAPQISQVSE